MFDADFVSQVFKHCVICDDRQSVGCLLPGDCELLVNPGFGKGAGYSSFLVAKKGFHILHGQHHAYGAVLFGYDNGFMLDGVEERSE